MEIRKAVSTDDFNLISRIYALSWKTAYKDIVPKQYLDDLPENRWENILRNSLDDVFVLIENGKYIGASSICAARDEKMSGWGEIVSIYLLPEYFSKGFGKPLLENSISALLNRGYTNIYLWTLEDNLRARRFYEKNCFKFYDKKIINIGDKDLTEICYTYRHEVVNMQKKILYIDSEQLNYQNTPNCGVYGVIAGNEEEVELKYAGKIIVPAPLSEKGERIHKILTDECDVQFIFEDNIPAFQFYPVPSLMIFATDSVGGCFASTNSTMDINEKDAPIYYIDQNSQVYYLADNLIDFMHMLVFYPSWKMRLGLFDRLLTISDEGKSCLLELFSMKDDYVFDENRTNINTFTLYPTIDDAKKEVEFHDISELLRSIQ